ncbi:MAG: acylphosphatase [Candidatus Thermoplasmatota archaeon]|jgi:acylphosphatase|nr:acylphosphatase [Candidatus Thermoplasmatota archaeon]
MTAVIARFSGVVQGVNFRRNFSSAAISLGLNGWVKNLPDGDVEAFIQGDREKIQKLLDESRGLPNAVVTGIVLKEADEQDINVFEIRP